jgi:hypothetical protein
VFLLLLLLNLLSQLGETQTTTTVKLSTDSTGRKIYFSTVSLVDGYNLPLSITNTVGCSTADCPVDLGPNCQPTLSTVPVRILSIIHFLGPAPLIGPFDSTGFPVGCKSACEADLDGDPCNYYTSTYSHTLGSPFLLSQLAQLLYRPI